MNRVFTRPKYVFLALLVAITFFVLSSWLGLLPLLLQILLDPSLSLFQTIHLVGPLFLRSLFDFTTFSLLYTLTAAGLFGINVALLTFYFKLFRLVSKTGIASGFAGIVAAVFGFGCAACGSIFFTTLLGTFGGAGILALMPYKGAEIGILGITLLIFSASVLSRAILKPPVCPI